MNEHHPHAEKSSSRQERTSSSELGTVVFPAVQAVDLLRRRVDLPQSFQGRINIVFVAFQQWQQAEVDSWKDCVSDIEAKYADIVAYELPVLRNMNFFGRMFINEAMRAAIPDQTTRERTLTIYIDKQTFKQALSMADENNIYVLVLDQAGRVLWRTRGVCNSSACQGLWDEIEALS